MKRLIILSMISFCLFSQTEVKAQFKLQLVRIKCLDPQDNDDETLIFFNNEKVWKYDDPTHAGDIGSGDLAVNDVRSLTHLRPYKFNCPISIRIYDEEGIGSDDYIGKLIVNMSPSEYRKIGIEQTKKFNRAEYDCEYEITYKVLIDI